MPQHETYDYSQDVALEDLQQEAKTPEDQEYLNTVQTELDESFRKGLAAPLPNLVQLQNGTVTTHEAIQKDRAAGHDMGNSHVGGRVS